MCLLHESVAGVFSTAHCTIDLATFGLVLVVKLPNKSLDIQSLLVKIALGRFATIYLFHRDYPRPGQGKTEDENEQGGCKAGLKVLEAVVLWPPTLH